MLPLLEVEAQFNALVESVQDCVLCAEMANCTRVLSWANGRPTATIMFVGEAPGRLGADRTAIPFHGDKAGDNFEKLINLGGFSRNDIFVTNAVLCNPKDENGNNAPPSRLVLQNCSLNLAKQIDLINPSIVVTLGAAALESTRMIESHSLSLSASVRTITEWYGRRIAPLYHPGARAMIHRSFSLQTADYYFLGEQFRRLNGRRGKTRTPRQSDYGWKVVTSVLASLRTVSLFRLHKILYLLDYKKLTETGQTATGFFYIRQKDGPYCVELGGGWHRQYQELKLRKLREKLFIEWQGASLFESLPILDDGDTLRLQEILSSLSKLTDEQVKTRAYLTQPMRKALRAEKSGVSQLNKPLL